MMMTLMGCEGLADRPYQTGVEGELPITKGPTTTCCPDYRTTIYYSQCVHCNGVIAMMMTKRIMMTIIIMICRLTKLYKGSRQCTDKIIFQLKFCSPRSHCHKKHNLFFFISWSLLIWKLGKTFHFKLSPFKMPITRETLNPMQYDVKSLHEMGEFGLGAKANWSRRKNKFWNIVPHQVTPLPTPLKTTLDPFS